MAVRKTTNRLIQLAEDSAISWQTIAEMALNYMSEDEVSDMCKANDIFPDEEEY